MLGFGSKRHSTRHSCSRDSSGDCTDQHGTQTIVGYSNSKHISRASRTLERVGITHTQEQLFKRLGIIPIYALTVTENTLFTPAENVTTVTELPSITQRQIKHGIWSEIK